MTNLIQLAEHKSTKYQNAIMENLNNRVVPVNFFCATHGINDMNDAISTINEMIADGIITKSADRREACTMTSSFIISINHRIDQYNEIENLESDIAEQIEQVNDAAIQMRQFEAEAFEAELKAETLPFGNNTEAFEYAKNAINGIMIKGYHDE